MLPSKEKFHFYACPYFIMGTCERPYCHFKHAEVEEEKVEADFCKDKCPKGCPCETTSKTEIPVADSLSEKDGTALLPTIHSGDAKLKAIPSLVCKQSHNLEQSETGFKRSGEQFFRPEQKKLNSYDGYTHIFSNVRKQNKETGNSVARKQDIIKSSSTSKSHSYEPTPIEELKLREAEILGEIRLGLQVKEEPEDIDLCAPEREMDLPTLRYEPSRVKVEDFDFLSNMNSKPNLVKNEIKQESLEDDYAESGIPPNNNQVFGSNYPMRSFDESFQRYDIKREVQETTVSYCPYPLKPRYSVDQIKLEFSETSKDNTSKVTFVNSGRAQSLTCDNINACAMSSSADKEAKHGKSSSRTSHKTLSVPDKEFGQNDVPSKNSTPDKYHSSRHSKSSTHHSKKHSGKDSSRHRSSSSRTKSRHSSEKDKGSKNVSPSQNKSSSNRSRDKEKSSLRKSNSEKLHSASSKHSSSSTHNSKSSDKVNKRESLSKRGSHSSSSNSSKTKSGSLGTERKVSTCEDNFTTRNNDESESSDVDPASDVMTEVAKVFEEANMFGTSIASSSESKSSVVEKDAEPEMVYTSIPTKKRIAHESAGNRLPSYTPKRIIRPITASAGQVLAERWRKQKEAQLQKTTPTGTSSVDQLLGQLTDDTEPKNSPARPWLSAFNPKPVEKSEDCTIAQTVKGKKRVAHNATQSFTNTPIIQAAPGDKIPCSKRQFVLSKFYEECKKQFTDHNLAYEKAVNLELECLKNSTSVPVYNNVFLNKFIKLKKGTPESQPSNTITKISAELNDGVICKKITYINKDLTGRELYDALQKYVLNAKDRKEHSFPYRDNLGMCKIENIERSFGKNYLDSTDKCCSRCHKKFSVDDDGMPKRLTSDQLCRYHPKRVFPQQDAYAQRILIHICCKAELGKPGCEVCSYHVDTNFYDEFLTGFVETYNKGIPKNRCGVYALDCEMCVTTRGLEVVRVTILNETSEQFDSTPALYDKIVETKGKIVDYCTSFSGITEEIIKNFPSDRKVTFEVMQKELLQLFSEDTILIGHSLGNDLRYLKIIHKTVIDTAEVFPHKRGLPYKRALKTIAKDYLHRLIQDGDEGHDSREDAQTCLDLMKYKVRSS